MKANIRSSFTLTQIHDDLIRHVAETSGVSASEALRLICDCAIDMNPDIAKHLLEKEQRFKKLELKSIEQRIASAKNSDKDNPFRRLAQLRKQDKSSDVRTLDDMSPKEIIANYIDDVGKNTPSGKIARERIQNALKDNPELLAELPEDKRQLFEPGGGE